MFWKATERLGYPFGDMLRVCLLTGQRRGEVASIERDEVDFARAEWIVPARKMKMKDPHFVPLAPQVVEVLSRAPRHNEGQFVFSGTGGREPVSGFSKAMKRLRDEMNALHREETGNPKAELEHFRCHDLRRTCRSKISRYTTQEIAELIIAHRPKGIVAVYALYDFADERREVLRRWAREVESIVTKKPAEVIPFSAAARLKKPGLMRLRRRGSLK
ncbi:site-specific integrase [Hyphomicrobium sp. CS1GBMeth3]|uniref:site-specific integrase n=1 Tax=Hyphomicrobium sp. CS1GBMeth3 TaxID=1892845 RepID=UPI001FCE04D7|nr:site-specific integrase [Hyphomicrobium sp. CS1GBMeth3]